MSDERINIDAYPARALFEGVINAVAHRDYYLDGKVLSFCYLKARKVAEIAAHLGISDSTYLRKQILGNMENNDYLVKSKVSRATYYKTNPEMVTVE